MERFLGVQKYKFFYFPEVFAHNLFAEFFRTSDGSTRIILTRWAHENPLKTYPDRKNGFF